MYDGSIDLNCVEAGNDIVILETQKIRKGNQEKIESGEVYDQNMAINRDNREN